MIVVAQLANETLYYMPQSWLYKQEHLLQQGEIDPHKFVGAMIVRRQDAGCQKAIIIQKYQKIAQQC